MLKMKDEWNKENERRGKGTFLRRGGTCYKVCARREHSYYKGTQENPCSQRKERVEGQAQERLSGCCEVSYRPV